MVSQKKLKKHKKIQLQELQNYLFEKFQTEQFKKSHKRRSRWCCVIRKSVAWSVRNFAELIYKNLKSNLTLCNRTVVFFTTRFLCAKSASWGRKVDKFMKKKV